MVPAYAGTFCMPASVSRQVAGSPAAVALPSTPAVTAAVTDTSSSASRDDGDVVHVRGGAHDGGLDRRGSADLRADAIVVRLEAGLGDRRDADRDAPSPRSSDGSAASRTCSSSPPCRTDVLSTWCGRLAARRRRNRPERRRSNDGSSRRRLPAAFSSRSVIDQSEPQSIEMAAVLLEPVAPAAR